jgi:aqualysin 1
LPNEPYSATIRGFAARLPDAAVEALSRNPNVLSVEPDMVLNVTEGIQTAAPWALDRVDQSGLPLDSRYVYPGTGAGVNIYIIDSGIRSSHVEFTGRVAAGFSFVDDGNGAEDCMGHGTHVAGIAAGSTYGVAKEAMLHPVRVFGCSGGTSISTVIAAVEWVTAHAAYPAVVNMSLGGALSTALNGAVIASIESGLTYTVSAGNAYADACRYSPAAVAAALTVAASNSADSAATFSNYGSCVDLYAPGVGVLSAWPTGDEGTRFLNGTSMSAPHVAGAAALYLQAYPGASPADVAAAVSASATQKKILPRMSNTINSLLNVSALLNQGGGGGSTGKTKPKPGNNGKGKTK